MWETKLITRDGSNTIPDLHSLEHKGWNLKHDLGKKLSGGHYFTTGLCQTSQIQPEDLESRK